MVLFQTTRLPNYNSNNSNKTKSNLYKPAMGHLQMWHLDSINQTHKLLQQFNNKHLELSPLSAVYKIHLKIFRLNNKGYHCQR